MDENFLEKAGEGDICFVENQSLKGTEGRIEKLIVFGWNRAYPFDLKLDLDLNQMEKTAEEEFAGYSHEKDHTVTVQEERPCMRKELFTKRAEKFLEKERA